jgi:2,6-dihydroxypyridine 3-monooxygenase
MSARVAIAGGSIGGLTVGVLLHEAGYDVHVYERSTQALQARGAGIVVLPMTERYFRERGGDLDRHVALTLTNWSYIGRGDELISENTTYDRFSSWNTVYRALRDRMPDDRYHLSSEMVSFEQADEEVTVRFAGRAATTADLLICADGISSTGRSILLPDVRPEYAGYVAWRGTVPEQAIPARVREAFADAMIYQVLDHSHVLVYAIPSDDNRIDPGHRLLNFVWYRNYPAGGSFEDLMRDRNGVQRPLTLPPGLVREEHLEEMRAAARAELAPTMAEVVLTCADPFIQAVFDVTSPRMAFGRVILLGDAAWVLRPHVAAGTAKAAADGWALLEALEAHAGDITAALPEWEARQLEVARNGFARTVAMGRAAQVLGTMWPGDPDWRFGLFGPGN